MPIKFTEFVRPRGRRIDFTVACSAVTEKKAAEIAAKGWKFEMEVLTTNQVSLEICQDVRCLSGALLSGALCSKKTMSESVTSMVNDAYNRLKDRGEV